MLTKIDDLYFGVMVPKMNWNSRAERGSMVRTNLFNSPRVKWAVARYVTMTSEEREALLSSPLYFCFGDVWGRCEYEFIVCPWPYNDDEKIAESGNKVDVFTMYVEPNADYLMELVNSVSVESAKEYLKAEKRRLKK